MRVSERSPKLSPAQWRAHDEAEAAEEPGYMDPETGLFVMTTTQLRDQGVCCGNGCRHCPYPPDEQRRAGRPGS